MKNLNILWIISSIRVKPGGVCYGPTEWQRCSLIRKPPPTSQRGTFTISPTCLLAGRVDECTKHSWQFTDIQLVSSHTDSSLVQHVLIWLLVWQHQVRGGAFTQENMIDYHPSEKLVAAAQYLKHACLLTLVIWCHKKKDTLTSACFHKILYLISRSIKNINFRWIVVHTKARCSRMMCFCLNDHQLVPDTVPLSFSG